MEVLIIVAVLVILLILWAVLNKIDWFSLLNFQDKYAEDYDGRYSDYFKDKINGGLPYNANAKIRRANGELSVINDGYGSSDAPYEVWEQSHNQLESKHRDEYISWDEYEDVEGWLTEEEVAKLVRKWY